MIFFYYYSSSIFFSPVVGGSLRLSWFLNDNTHSIDNEKDEKIIASSVSLARNWKMGKNFVLTISNAEIFMKKW